MSKLLTYYTSLKKLSQNIKKSINNKTRVSTLERQLAELNFLSQKVEKKLCKEEDLSDAVFSDIVKTLETSKILNNILSHKIKKLKMTEPQSQPAKFDIKTATALVQTYNGMPDGLDSFIDSAKMLKEIIPAGQEAIAVKFLKTRLSGKARLGLNGQSNTIQALIDDVTNRCTDTVTPEEIIAKLTAIKKSNSVQTLCDEVENLTMKLKTIYVSKKNTRRRSPEYGYQSWGGCIN